MQIKKELGRFSSVAEDPLVDVGYSKVDATPLKESDIWKDNVFYQQDYYHLICEKNLRVVAAQGMSISPDVGPFFVPLRTRVPGTLGPFSDLVSRTHWGSGAHIVR